MPTNPTAGTGLFAQNPAGISGLNGQKPLASGLPTGTGLFPQNQQASGSGLFPTVAGQSIQKNTQQTTQVGGLFPGMSGAPTQSQNSTQIQNQGQQNPMTGN